MSAPPAPPDLMKRLLLLPFLCLMPAAQAVDYVKCEAMQKAATRLTATKEAETMSMWRAYLDSASEACPVGMDMDDWSQCRDSFSEKNRAQNDALRAEVAAQYDERLAKIKADYQAKGCY